MLQTNQNRRPRGRISKTFSARALTVGATLAAMGLFSTQAVAADVTRTYDVTASVFTDSNLALGPVQAFEGVYTITFDPAMDVQATTTGLTVDLNTLPYTTEYTYNAAQDILTIATEPTTAPSFFDDPDTYGTFIGGATAAAPFSYGVDYEGDDGDIYGSNIYTVTASPLMSAAPEPSTWALLIGGIGIVGLTFRQAKRRRGLTFRRAFAG